MSGCEEEDIYAFSVPAPEAREPDSLMDGAEGGSAQPKTCFIY